jgi:hypothetical protein
MVLDSEISDLPFTLMPLVLRYAREDSSGDDPSPGRRSANRDRSWEFRSAAYFAVRNSSWSADLQKEELVVVGKVNANRALVGNREAASAGVPHPAPPCGNSAALHPALR